MKYVQISIIIGIVILLTSCSPSRKFVRTTPDFQTIRENIDSIAILSDALVAIDEQGGYYSTNASYLLDSLIIDGVTNSLSKKGYTPISVEPCFMGSFMDSGLAVPLKPLNDHSIQLDVLPQLWQCNLSSSQQGAIKRINRKLYLNLAYSDPKKPNSLSLSDQTKSDLGTIALLTKSDYAFFVLHQAGLVDPALSAGMAVGTAALTAVLSGGMFIAVVSKESVFHTYLILVELSTGKLLWSNYLPNDAAPTTPVLKMSKNYEKSVTAYIKADSLSRRVLSRWYKNYLSAFPDRSKTEYFKGHAQRLRYPVQNFFRQEPYNNSLDLTNSFLRRKIDSLTTELSISEKVITWIDDDTNSYDMRNGRTSSSVNQELSALKEYFKYAHYCRSKFKAPLQGRIKMSFIITAKGNVKRLRVVESTVNDDILNYVTPKIVKMVKFSTFMVKGAGATEVTHEVVFGQ